MRFTPNQSDHQPRSRRPQPSCAVVPNLGRSDARWLLAARACVLVSPAGHLPPDARERILRSARHAGLAPIHAAGIIAIAESAAARGGLDHLAHTQLQNIPIPAPKAHPGEALNKPRVILIAALAALIIWLVR